MANEKAKGNKTLVCACEGCGKEFSTELMTGKVVGADNERRIVPLCATCAPKGWPPPPAEAQPEGEEQPGDATGS